MQGIDDLPQEAVVEISHGRWAIRDGSLYCEHHKNAVEAKAAPVDFIAAFQQAEDTRLLTRNPSTCQHTEAYWNAEEDCFSCGLDPTPEEPAPVETP